MSQYSDDSLVFCLQDGTRLIEESITGSRTAGIDRTEDETVIARRHDRDPLSQVTQWRDQGGIRGEPTPRRSRTAATILISGAGIIILGLVGAGVIGAWLYFRGAGSVKPNNDNALVNQSRANVSPLPSNTPPSPTVTPPSNVKPPSNSFSVPPGDDETAKRGVSQTIITWKSLAEARSLDAYMGLYADTVDYYNHHSVSRDVVRRDKQRAFSMFSSINVSISNMDVTLGQDGQTATSSFDKEWVFVGDHRNVGKVRSQLTFRKVNSEWLITGERDLKIYYTR
jgi:hypothetical protein